MVVPEVRLVQASGRLGPGQARPGQVRLGQARLRLV